MFNLDAGTKRIIIFLVAIAVIAVSVYAFQTGQLYLNIGALAVAILLLAVFGKKKSNTNTPK